MHQIALVLACFAHVGYGRCLHTSAGRAPHGAAAIVQESSKVVSMEQALKGRIGNVRADFSRWRTFSSLLMTLMPAATFHASFQGAPFRLGQSAPATLCTSGARGCCRCSKVSPFMQRIYDPGFDRLQFHREVEERAAEFQRKHFNATLGPKESLQLKLWVHWNRTLGPEHSGTLTSKKAVAVIMKDHGNLEGATELLRGVWLSLNRTLGPNHPDASNSELTYQRFHLEQTENAYGPAHNLTLNLKSEVANKLLLSKDLEGAATLQDQVFRAREKKLGLKHPDTLESARELAMIQRKSGDLDRAMSTQKSVYVLRNQTLGMEHPDTLQSKLDLTMIYQQLRELEDAEKLQREVLESVESLRLDDPLTLRAQHALASTLRLRGDADGAEHLVQAALDTRLRVFGPDHPDTLKSKLILARILEERRDLAGAEKLQREVLQARMRQLGLNNTNTLDAMSALAKTLYYRMNLENARMYQQQVWEAKIGTLGPEHPDTVKSMKDLATTLEDYGNRQKAENLRREALALEAKSRNSSIATPDSSEVAGPRRTPFLIPDSRNVENDEVAMSERLFATQATEANAEDELPEEVPDSKNDTFRPLFKLRRRLLQGFADIRKQQRLARAERQNEEKIRSRKGRMPAILQAQWYTSDDWFRVLSHTPWSRVTRRVSKYVYGISFWALIMWMVQAHAHFPTDRLIRPVQLLGFAVGLQLVFRLRASYDRFWEGRKMWEQVQAHITDLAQKVMFYRRSVPKDLQKRVKNLMFAFPSLLAEHLGGPENKDFEYSQILTKQDLEQIQVSKTAPLYVTNQLGDAIMQIPLRGKEQENSFTNSERRDLLAEVKHITERIWVGERLLQTPVPPMFVEHLSSFLTMWLLSFTIAFVGELGLFIVPFMAFVSWALFGIMEIGLLIEEPFKRELQIPVYVRRTCDTVMETMNLANMESYGEIL